MEEDVLGFDQTQFDDLIFAFEFKKDSIGENLVDGADDLIGRENWKKSRKLNESISFK